MPTEPTGSISVPSRPAGAPDPPRRGAPRRRHWAALVALIAVVGYTVSWAWRPLDTTFAAGYGIRQNVAVGERVWSTLDHVEDSDADRVTITGVEPENPRDGTDAEVEYVVCDLDPAVLEADGVVGFGYGLDDGDRDRYCTATRPADGATVNLHGRPSQALLVGVTPTRPGRTVIGSHRVAYRDGWRTGSDEVGAEIALVVRGR